jgi:rSAM/selenodomain-associated transferase 2
MISTPLKTSDISIIVPTLNEEKNLPLLAKNLEGGDFEVIIADGGSTDATVDLARQYPFTVISCNPGRGHQQNRGAQQAKGKILLFLHADTRLPENFAARIVQTIKAGNCIAGAFSLAIDKPTPAMRAVSALANLRSYLLQLPYGDQAIFIDRDVFLELQMFPELPIMEDYVFIQRAKKYGKIVVLKDRVVTSARRWRKLGVVRTTLINQLVILGFYFKVSPEKLALLYRR